MKEKLRKYSFSLRKNKYFNLTEKDFSPLLSEITRYKNNIVGSYYSINGSGYYDKYFNMLNKTKKRFRTIGIGFSFQKKDKLKVLKTDFCLDAVFTEKGFLNIQ